MTPEVLKALEGIQLDPISPANILYVKARCAIEETAKNRDERREAKNGVIALLKGELVHHQSAANRGVVRKEVKFPDGTTARF